MSLRAHAGFGELRRDEASAVPRWLGSIDVVGFRYQLEAHEELRGEQTVLALRVSYQPRPPALEQDNAA